MQRAPSGWRAPKANSRQGSRYVGQTRMRCQARRAGCRGGLAAGATPVLGRKAVYRLDGVFSPRSVRGYQDACRVPGAPLRPSGARAEAFWQHWRPRHEPPLAGEVTPLAAASRGPCGPRNLDEPLGEGVAVKLGGHAPGAAAVSFDWPQWRSRRRPSLRL